MFSNMNLQTKHSMLESSMTDAFRYAWYAFQVSDILVLNLNFKKGGTKV